MRELKKKGVLAPTLPDCAKACKTDKTVSLILASLLTVGSLGGEPNKGLDATAGWVLAEAEVAGFFLL